MEQIEIRNRVHQMKTVEELASLLSVIKFDEFGKKKYPITVKQLRHFSYADIAPNRYKTFQIRKKNGGLREINAPCYQLGIILYLLNIVFKNIYTPSPSVMGFTEGKSVVDNAKIHIGHNYVFNIDLKNFFPSIPQSRVWARLQCPPFSFSKEISNVVAGLCCHKNADSTKNVLPQGSPTSPLLTNAICDHLDRKMCGVAKRFGLHYTRYADDMTFSSMHNVYQDNSDFRNEIERIISEEGFTMNNDKTRLQREGSRQEVTGLIVNETLNVSRKYISDLRWIMSVWEREGYSVAYAKFYIHYKREKGYIKKGEPVMENVIGGKLDYLRMVRGDNNLAYQKLRTRFDKLQQVVYIDKETDNKQSYVFVQPYHIEDFIELLDTSILLEVTPKSKLVGKCIIAGMEKILAISKATQQYLCPNIDELMSGTIVSTDLLNDCFVTLCRSKGKNFWLITKDTLHRSECMSILNANIYINQLLRIWEIEGLESAVKAFNNYVLKGEQLPSSVMKSNRRPTNVDNNITIGTL